MPQTRKERTSASCLIEYYAFDTQFMMSCRVDCFKFPIIVFGRSPRIHSSKDTLMESFNGLLMHLSIGCTVDVRPQGMITMSALHSRCAISMLAAAWCGLYVAVNYKQASLLLTSNDMLEPVMVFTSCHPPISGRSHSYISWDSSDPPNPLYKWPTTSLWLSSTRSRLQILHADYKDVGGGGGACK